MGDLPGKTDGSLAGFTAGSQVAGYRLERQVGAGGMAVVFRARDERLGRRVALKILAPALASDEGFRQRFLQESRAAAAVDDPHIIPVYEAGEADGVLFIAMRYVPGGDLRSLIRRAGPLPPARVDALISPVAAALDAAHAAGLVHRDVKPANMLIDARPGRADHVYLSDFGLSKAALSPADLTGTGQFLGTADYISPEQVAGVPVDGRADQYALACAAFELLTGAPPFRRDDLLAVIYAQASEPPPLLTSRRPDLPPEADQVFATALAKAPEDRYPTCQDFAEALCEALGLAAWDSGPDDIAAGTHPPTKFAWSPTPRVPQEPNLAAAGLGPDSDEAGMVTGDAYLPAALATTGGPGYADPGYPDPGHSGPFQRRPRRSIVIALTVITILMTGGAATAASLAFRGPPALGIQIAAKSGQPPAGGDVYVRYRDSSNATAQIYGQVSDAASGEIARLYAQPFPYRSAAVLAGSVILRPAGTMADYAFRVTPSLATRYKVELFRNGAAARPLATSPATTIYVTATAVTGSAQKCRRPVCHEKFSVRVLVPAPALGTEMAQQWYPYSALKTAPAREPPSPQVLLLGTGTPQISKTQRVSRDEFGLTITFSFPIGNHAYSWNWTACSRPAEAADGIGLPGQNGCGSERTRASAAGMLVSPCTHVHPCAAPAPGVKARPRPGQTSAPVPTPVPSPQPTPDSSSATHPPPTSATADDAAAATTQPPRDHPATADDQPPPTTTADHPATAHATAAHQRSEELRQGSCAVPRVAGRVNLIRGASSDRDEQVPVAGNRSPEVMAKAER